MIKKLKRGTPREIIISKILESKDKSIKPKSKADFIIKLDKIMEILHTYSNRVGFLLDSNYLLRSDYKTNEMAIKAALKLNLEIMDSFMNTLNEILSDNKRVIAPTPSAEENLEYFLNIIKDISFKNSNDFDNFIKKVISKEGFLRFFQSVTQIVSNYSAFKQYYSLAEPKEPDVFSLNMMTDDYRFRVLEDLDPYHFQVGGDTGCCQIIGGFGEQAAVDSFINPKSGVVLLESNKDGAWKLVSQSYFHVFELPNVKGIILDNIEAGSLGDNVMKDIPQAYAVLGKYLNNKGFSIVGCGMAYTQVISGMHFEISSLSKDPRTFSVADPYTDFNPSLFYNILKPKFNVIIPKITSVDNFKLSKESSNLISIYKNSFLLGRSNYMINKLSILSKALHSIGFYKESNLISKLIR
jgi:hypothetical protein